MSMYACMCTCGGYVLNKGVWPNARMIIRVTAHCLAQKGTYSVMDMRIEFQLTLRHWDPELARKCSDIRAVQGQRSLCTYAQNVPDSEHSGEQNSMCLITNMHLQNV